ncbi:MAG: hypothetical protein H0V97_08285 [Actinobacteria bacterium]|nr:hypothetical protein [Actinomycetota bacterium]
MDRGRLRALLREGFSSKYTLHLFYAPVALEDRGFRRDLGKPSPSLLPVPVRGPDVGRVAVPARIWQETAPLTPDDWERVRLHAYHSERVLSRSLFLAALAPAATAHHERLDGSGYHRGMGEAELTPAARVLAAAAGRGACICVTCGPRRSFG